MPDNLQERYELAPGTILRTDPDSTDGSALLVYRPGSRRTVKVVDAAIHSLLLAFRQPSTIADAMSTFISRSIDEAPGDDPGELFDALWPTIARLLDAQILLPEGQAAPILRILRDGEAFNGLVVHECVRLMEDTQVYRAEDSDGALVALKVASLASHRKRLRWEGTILAEIAGVVAPRLRRVVDTDPYTALVMDWCEGVPIAKVVGKGSRQERTKAVLDVVAAYTRLHSLGFLHGDVAPDNGIITPTGCQLIDFSWTTRIGSPSTTGLRSGKLAFQEPEAWTDEHASAPSAQPTPAGEQYSVAVICYQLLHGHLPWILPSDRTEALRIILGSNVPMRGRLRELRLGEVDDVVARGMARDPNDRFPSIAVMELELRRVIAGAVERQPAESPTRRFVSMAAPGGEWFSKGLETAPLASVNLGAAGVSLALAAIALRKEDGSTHALAQDWARRATMHMREPLAYSDGSAVMGGLVSDGLSVLHGPAGIHLVQLLTDESWVERKESHRPLAALLRIVAAPVRRIELALGSSGLLAGLAALVEKAPDREDVRSAGDRLMSELISISATGGHVSEDRSLGLNLGMAHGWAGFLWAIAQWCIVTGTGMPEQGILRAHELLEVGQRKAGAIRWPWRGARHPFVPGWCNGAAGYVLWLCSMHEVHPGGPWLDSAAAAARPLLEVQWGASHLCCGACGGVFALSHLARLTEDSKWRRACTRCRDAAMQLDFPKERPWSLYKGAGALVLVDCPADELIDLRIPGLGAQRSDNTTPAHK